MKCIECIRRSKLRHARKLKKIKDYIEIKLLQEVFFLVFMTEMKIQLRCFIKQMWKRVPKENSTKKIYKKYVKL